MSQATEKSVDALQKRSRISRVRKSVLGVTFALFCIGVVISGGLGDACSVGYDAIAAVCPLGALESIFGSWAFAPRLVIGLIFALVVVLVVGRAFCSWICPVPPLQGFLQTKKRKHQVAADRKASAEQSLEKWKQVCGGCAGSCTGSCGSNVRSAEEEDNYVEESAKRRSGLRLDSRHAVLAGALATTALCGFPVFCLVCPVGLTFATVIALYRFIGFNEPAIDLIVFPAIIVLELVFLRKWCHRFCPISALLSLFAPLARRLRPVVDTENCLRSSGEDCVVCGSVCPEGIDPVGNLGDRPLYECTRCGRCAEACPTQAIAFHKRRK